jgi:ceramide glucosyltransferase
MPEFLAGGLPPLLGLGAAVAALGFDVTMPAMIFAAVWYMPELLLVRAAGWPRTLPALLLRDALLPAVYVAGLLGRSFEWHGHRMVTAPAAETRRWTLSGGLSKLRGFL